MYEERTLNYDPGIHEEYLMHDTPLLLPHHVYPYADYIIAINITN